ncbi:hypothetical protein [Paenibacillus sp. NPDC058071]|uniref:hypothetical protein n=1 Tax=Paenibacillus sp. NPDC058071 TaxID=3346326 RepID=UPI0036DF6897
MNEERRQTIVREIEYWRRSRLLPDQYCDFLLNLYADQDREQKSAKRESNYAVAKAVAAIQRASGKHWLLTFGLFTLISFVVLYFNAFHPVLQIAICVAGTAILLWLGGRFKKRNASAGIAFSGGGMLLFIGSGLYLLQLHGLEDWGWKTGLLGLCAIFWIVYGIAARIPILHLCGWIAALLVYAWLMSQFIAPPTWYQVQLYWMPLSILFGWSSWFVHRWSKEVSAVLFIAAGLVWFMPELYAQLFVDQAGPILLQLQLLVKFAIGGAVLFSFRKKWIEWVA